MSFTPTLKDVARFEVKYKVDPATGCWLWTAGKSQGYAAFNFNGSRSQGHIFSFLLYRGFVPDELTRDHLCRVRSCVNPWHLEIVTRGVNVLRGIGVAAVNAKKAVCIRGHPFSGNNLAFKKNGWRRCRTCDRDLKRQKNGYIGVGMRTHCPYGHAYSGDNLHITRKGTKWCRACDRDRHRAYKTQKGG